jgi:hypothetical protein
VAEQSPGKLKLEKLKTIGVFVLIAHCCVVDAGSTPFDRNGTMEAAPILRVACVLLRRFVAPMGTPKYCSLKLLGRKPTPLMAVLNIVIEPVLEYIGGGRVESHDAQLKRIVLVEVSRMRTSPCRIVSAVNITTI